MSQPIDNRAEHLAWVETALRRAHSGLPDLRLAAQSHYGPPDHVAFVVVHGVDADQKRRRQIRADAGDLLRRIGYRVALDPGRDVYDLRTSACAKPAVLQGQETEHRADAPVRASKQERACIDSSGGLKRLAAIESFGKKDPNTYQRRRCQGTRQDRLLRPERVRLPVACTTRRRQARPLHSRR